jgi:hypothetical protein
MGYQTLIIVLLLWGTQAPATAAPPPEFGRKFPFAYAITQAGEINGAAYFTARGVTPESPSVAVASLKRAFGDETTFAQVVQGKHGVFWQWRGVSKLSRDEKKVNDETLKRLAGGVGAKVGARLQMFPLGTVIWAFDLMCSLHYISADGYCPDLRPVDIVRATDRLVPRPQWHSVTLEARADGTHFTWTVWPDAELAGIVGIGDEDERKLICRRAKHPIPAGSDCMIVATFVSDEAAGRIEISHSPLARESTEKYVIEQLRANGWRELEAMAAPGFQVLRNMGSSGTLFLSLQAQAEGGTRVFLLETGGGV